jgi:hypothetical protein
MLDADRWISQKEACEIVGLGYGRASRYLLESEVRNRAVPWGPNRKTHQFWLADVLAISRLPESKGN